MVQNLRLTAYIPIAQTVGLPMVQVPLKKGPLTIPQKVLQSSRDQRYFYGFPQVTNRLSPYTLSYLFLEAIRLCLLLTYWTYVHCYPFRTQLCVGLKESVLPGFMIPSGNQKDYCPPDLRIPLNLFQGPDFLLPHTGLTYSAAHFAHNCVEVLRLCTARFYDSLR